MCVYEGDRERKKYCLKRIGQASPQSQAFGPDLAVLEPRTVQGGPGETVEKR